MKRLFAGVVAALATLASLVATAAPAAEPVWPTMRHDTRNTGAAELRGVHRGDRPWSFTTGRGIFSTPVVDGGGTVYVGSADTVFYALRLRDGSPRWRFRTGGIIDAAGALDGRGGIIMGSGDEVLYKLRTRDRRVVWRYRTRLPPATGQLVSWWEGNVALGPDRNVYVGNTGGGAYSFTPSGRLRWVRQRGNSVWTTPAFGRDGATFWGSLDLNAFSLDRDGRDRWNFTKPNFFVSSPALGADGTVFIGSFDNGVYALDPDTGEQEWEFRTGDHIYSSPALVPGPRGRTALVVIGSTDGSIYALDPATGRQRWHYDTGDPVRSSPVVGRAPRGGGRIVYVGSSDGRLYALDAATGRRRWSFDTTPRDPALRDRNDLNGSPALTPRGVAIGGEHGRVWHVPYDWCRRNARDPRCDTDPGQPFGRDLARLLRVTSGGTVVPRGDGPAVSPATALAARLVVRQGGVTRGAFLQPGLRISSSPPASFRTQLSGDGQELFLLPRGLLRAGTRYRIRVRADYAVGSRRAVELLRRRLDSTFTFRTASLARSRRWLDSGARDRVPALVLRRLAVPLPSFLPSVNQIGFDSYDFLVGALPTGRRDRALLWVVGARRDAAGRSVPDPARTFAFPLAGPARGDALQLSQRDVNLTFSFGPVPQERFDLRWQLERDGSSRPGTSAYGEVTCADVPNYGDALEFIGLCNPAGTLSIFGAFLTAPAPPEAGTRPRALTVERVDLTRPTATATGRLTARLRGRARGRLLSLLLVDERTGAPLALDYKALTRQRGGTVTLALPPGTRVPARLRAYVIAGIHPLAVRAL